MTGVWVALATLVLATGAGLVLRARNGRISTAAKEPGRRLPAAVRDLLDPEAPVTLVQISTTFCAPCRHTRARLAPLAERTEGLRHVELDVTNQPDVARDLGVLRTPTTLAFTGSGRELLRVTGLPDTTELLDALRPVLAESH